MRIALAALAAVIVSGVLAHAQPAPDTENGRYTFNQVAEGLLRLDTRTGQVSLCAKKDTGFACTMVPDERAALDSEVARLQRENGALKTELLTRGIALPNTVTGLPSGSPGAQPRDNEFKVPLPSDADIDRAMSVLEKVWRRFVDMIQRNPPPGEKL